MNLEQLNAMTDEQLDEAVALAQKWTVINGKWKTPVYNNENEEVVGNYHPTKNTTEGKAQAFDLMVKYGLEVDVTRKYVKPYNGYQFFQDGSKALRYTDNLQRAICEAVILSAQEK